MVDIPNSPRSSAPMGGGNMNAVVREGETVLRNAGVWTPTVHRYLDYLRVAGIDWVPRPVAIHPGTGGCPARERLSYLQGEVPAYPMPDWVWADDVLTDGARHLRRLHDASIGFGFGSDGTVWQSAAKIPAEVICHNDFSPHNLVFRNGRMIGAIDFDFCSPGPRLWDIAYFATRIAPLTALTPHNAPGMDVARSRVQLILKAYGEGHGAAAITWEDVLRVAIIRLYDLAEFSRDKAEELGKPELMEHALTYERDAGHLKSLRS